jgi:hypothetical protein
MRFCITKRAADRRIDKQSFVANAEGLAWQNNPAQSDRPRAPGAAQAWIDFLCLI